MKQNVAFPFAKWLSARSARGLAAGAVMATMFLSPLAVAGEVYNLDFVVHETLPRVTIAKMIRGGMKNCEAASVHSTTAGGSQRGDVFTFKGSKKIDCGSGNTLTLAYKVTTSPCKATDSGIWEVVRGTGIFAAAKGQGDIVGRYTFEGGKGTFCKNDGVDDHYTGKIQY